MKPIKLCGLRVGGCALWLLLASAVWLSASDMVAAPPANPAAEFLRQASQRLTDRIIEGAAQRYKLDDGQQEQLRSLLKERTDDFLKSQADALQEIGDEMLALQERGQQNPLEFLTILPKLRPIIEAGTKHMEGTGDLFRDKVLDEEQRKQFEADREAGRNVFAQQGRGRGRGGFGGGGFGPGGFGGGGNGASFTGRGFEEQYWESWLRRVGRAVTLTEEQTKKAETMLTEAKTAAADYRKAKEAEYKKVAADIAELREKPDSERSKIVEAAAAELSKPIDAIGNQWKTDVIGLLTEEQRKKLPAGAAPAK